MATYVYDVSSYFATGATVGAYLRDSFPQSRIDSPDGAAPGFAATETAVVSSTGTVTYTGLADATRYWLGTGSSPYDYVSVRTNPAASGGSGEVRGTRGKGYSVPDGSLDIFIGALPDADTELIETLWIGDSLTRGEGPAGGNYSFVQRLRQRFLAAGYPDGGRGWNETYDYDPVPVQPFQGEPTPIQSSDGFVNDGAYGIGGQHSDTSGDTITFAVRSDRARLGWHRYNFGADFSYSVNGGSAVTVQGDATAAPPRPIGPTTSWSPEVIVLDASDGMDAGETNLITVTNLGGASGGQGDNVMVWVEAINDTGLVLHNQGISGTSVVSFFNPDDTFFNRSAAVYLLGLQWGDGTNGFEIGASSDVLQSAQDVEDGPLDPAAARRPKLVGIAFGTNDMGVDRAEAVPAAPTPADGGAGDLTGTFSYKIARASAVGFLGPSSAASSPITVTSKQVALTMPGAQRPAIPVLPPVFNIYRATSPSTTYNLVGQVTGYNAVFLDNVATAGPAMPASNGTGRFIDTSYISEGLSLAVKMIRNAGADPLILVPAVDNLTPGYEAAIKKAFHEAAEMLSCAWVDLDIALGPNAYRFATQGGGNGNPHLLRPAYLLWADFLFDNVFAPLLGITAPAPDPEPEPDIPDPEPVDPADLNPAIWIKAADLTGLSDGDTIASFTESSTNALTFGTPGGAGQRPTYKTNIVNSLPVFRFDGGDGMQTASGTSPDLSGDLTILAVLKTTATGVDQAIIGRTAGGSPSEAHYTLNFSGDKPLLDRPFGASGTLATAAPGGSFAVVAVTVSGTDVAHYRNGAANGTSTLAGGTNRNAPTDFGSLSLSAQFFTGDIAEVLVWDSALDTEDLESMFDYAMTEYAIA